MKILYIGCVVYSKIILEHLIQHGYEIVGIITKDDTGFNADYFDLSHIAIKEKIPYVKTKNVNDAYTIEWVRSLRPDIVYCFGWNSLIGKEFISIPRKGIIGYHPAALPYNRGRHPIIWALALGLKQTASSFFLMGEGTDDGDIVSQEFLDIDFTDDANSLYHKLIEVSKIQVLQFTSKFADNQLIPIQQDHTKANLWRKRSKVDGLIDFRASSESIYNLVRALTKPYPGAMIDISGEEYSVWKVSMSNTLHENFEPGKILDIINKKILIKCGLREDAVLLEDHNLPENLEIGKYL